VPSLPSLLSAPRPTAVWSRQFWLARRTGRLPDRRHPGPLAVLRRSIQHQLRPQHEIRPGNAGSPQRLLDEPPAPASLKTVRRTRTYDRRVATAASFVAILSVRYLLVMPSAPRQQSHTQLAAGCGSLCPSGPMGTSCSSLITSPDSGKYSVPSPMPYSVIPNFKSGTSILCLLLVRSLTIHIS